MGDSLVTFVNLIIFPCILTFFFRLQELIFIHLPIFTHCYYAYTYILLLPSSLHYLYLFECILLLLFICINKIK